MLENGNWRFVIPLDVLHSDSEEEQESDSEGETSLIKIQFPLAAALAHQRLQ